MISGCQVICYICFESVSYGRGIKFYLGAHGGFQQPLGRQDMVSLLKLYRHGFGQCLGGQTSGHFMLIIWSSIVERKVRSECTNDKTNYDCIKTMLKIALWFHDSSHLQLGYYSHLENPGCECLLQHKYSSISNGVWMPLLCLWRKS